MTTWCILGGGGSFGVRLAMYLLNGRAERVIGIGRAPLRPEAFTFSLPTHPGYDYHIAPVGSGHVRLLELLDEARPEIIVNFAAQGEGAASWQHSWRFFDTNGTALVRLVEALGQRKWLKRFIQIGTSELYGSVNVPVHEEAAIRATSPYAASKAGFDLHLMAVGQTLGFPMNIIRPSNAYGPGQLLHRLIPKAIVCGLIGQKLPLQGGGLAEKSYIHSDDLADAIYRVATHAPLGRVYNAGPNRPTAIKEVVALCAEALGLEFAELCEMAPDRTGQDARYWLDSAKIYRDVGWTPTIGWEAGLANMVAWGRTYLDVLRDWPMTYELRA